MAGIAIFTVGLFTLRAHFANALSRERILLWFGLFAAPYGRALILRSILIPEWDARVDLVVVIVGRLIGLASSIPALLLFREFYERLEIILQMTDMGIRVCGSSRAVLHGKSSFRTSRSEITPPTKRQAPTILQIFAGWVSTRNHGGSARLHVCV
jgi:hypothetical protein